MRTIAACGPGEGRGQWNNAGGTASRKASNAGSHQRPAADPHRPKAQSGAAGGPAAAAVLDQDGITAAALQLIGKNGYDGLTMAALARSLNVAPSALYNHVASKRDVLLLVEDHLTSLVDVAAFGTGAVGARPCGTGPGATGMSFPSTPR